jgi:TctA family transporter
MAIFAGDIPGALLRIPGTPASAAYADDAYLLTKQGKGELALGICLVTSAIGGIFGTIILIVLAPPLADFALKFSMFEYFWLVSLGLTCAVFVTGNDLLRGLIGLLIGLAVACVGQDVTAGHPRYTFGVKELLSGIDFIPAMVGMFAVSELMRRVTETAGAADFEQTKFHSFFTGLWPVLRKFQFNIWRGHIIGTAIGIVFGGQKILEESRDVWQGFGRRSGRRRRCEQLGDRRRLGASAGVRHSRRQRDRGGDRHAADEKHPAGPGHLHREAG